MPSIFDYIFGPSLYRSFDENRTREYASYPVERYADIAIRLVSVAKSLAQYASPYLVYSFYRNYLSPNADLGTHRSAYSAFLSSNSFRFFATLTMVYLVSSVVRGLLRSRNPTYREFIQTFKSATTSVLTSDAKKDDDRVKQVAEARTLLRRTYDYDFTEWPVDFRWSEGVYARDRVPTLLPVKDSGGIPAGDGPVIRAASWLAAHSIGRIMLYPGSLGLLHKVLENALETGRQMLVENHQASRYKLEARDGNYIDCIFADNRKPEEPEARGNTLVICSEGNAGFYEIGIFSSPANLKYSVLGWNHPGFGASTGSPYPQNEINAFDSVINFAVTKLGFKLEDIYIFAWSIGGFPAAWAASNYPELKGVILDASFDDVLPLARARMMPLLLPLVDSTIRNYFNLNVSAYLNRFKGPVLLVRRLQDEIIPINPMDPVRTNCGNFILLKLLQTRFPRLMRNDEVYQQVQRFLDTEQSAQLYRTIDREQCLATLVSYITSNNVTTYPVDIDPEEVGVLLARDIITFMAYKLMKNFNSTHCTPLPSSMFEEPFDLFAISAKL